MTAQVETDSKQLKVMLAKTKAMSDYVQALIDEVDEHTKKQPSELRLMLQNEKNNFRHKRPSRKQSQRCLNHRGQY